jgi:hypothetical protein
MLARYGSLRAPVATRCGRVFAFVYTGIDMFVAGRIFERHQFT